MADSYSARFQRQPSCSCAPAMAGFVRGFDDDEDFDDLAGGGGGDSWQSSRRRRHAGRGASAGARLRGLWRRILRRAAARSCGGGGGGGAGAAPYDEETYAQNFDDGAAWVEPDNLARSFSARFAAPSRVLQSVA